MYVCEIVGYVYSGGCALCKKCHDEHCEKGSNFPELPYIKGYQRTLFVPGDYAGDLYCDECGNKI